jgi:hypothetical protein
MGFCICLATQLFYLCLEAVGFVTCITFVFGEEVGLGISYLFPHGRGARVFRFIGHAGLYAVTIYFIVFKISRSSFYLNT